VNRQKSKVDRASKVNFLGFSFYKYRGEVRIRVATKSLQRLGRRLRRLTRRTRPGKLEEVIREVNEYLRGWIGYFRLAATPSVFEDLDSWTRRRLRQMVWKRWKRGQTRYRGLVALGVPRERAALGALGKSPWRMSRTPVVNEALSNAYWQQLGLEGIGQRYRKLRQT
jgi:RNA-directed DNA polymerase